MRAVIQRVKESSVKVDGKLISEIGQGLMVLLGIEDADSIDDIEWLSSKIAGLRIFDDENGVMNLSVNDINADLLIISQFTLMASTKKGNRPSYIKASKAEISKPVYDEFCNILDKKTNGKVLKGIFGADMKVSLINDGPVTIVIDTKNKE